MRRQNQNQLDSYAGFRTTGSTTGSGVAPAERSGLNDAGQVVFGLTTTFSDNTQRYGIAIWSPTLKLLCASSRKSQGGKNFDVDLPLTGKLGVECRSGGAQGNFTLVLRFTNKLNSVGSASVTTGVGSVSGTPTINRQHHDGTVNNTDVNLVNAKVGLNASQANFRNDLDASGSITQDDVTVTQGQVGTSIP